MKKKVDKYSPVSATNTKYKSRTREGVTPAGRPYKTSVIRDLKSGKKLYKSSELNIGSVTHTKATGSGAPYARDGVSRQKITSFAGGTRANREVGSKVPLGKKNELRKMH